LGKQWENTAILKTPCFFDKFDIISAQVRHSNEL